MYGLLSRRRAKNGEWGVGSLYMLFFFESICYLAITSCILVLACVALLTFSIVRFYARNEGTGRHTKRGPGLIVIVRKHAPFLSAFSSFG
jgi:hypothetical protein